MPTPQAGIFTEGTRSHWFLEYRLEPHAELGPVCQTIAGLRREAGAQGLHLVVALGDRLAPRLLESSSPTDLQPFTPVEGDSRDLTGFIDGTANPSAEEAPEVVLVPDGEPGAAGSHVLAQRWAHDLDAFAALSTQEQEGIIGRTRSDSTAIPDRPESAHITRAELERDGVEQQIYRRSVPHGSVRRAGLNLAKAGCA